MDNQLVLGKIFCGKTLKYILNLYQILKIIIIMILLPLYDIVAFVSASGTSFNDETLLSYSSTGQLIFKSGPSKPKLELISLYQWSG